MTIQPRQWHQADEHCEEGARVRDQLAWLREQAFGATGTDNIVPFKA